MELKVPVVIDNEYIKKAVEEIKGEIKKDYVPRSVIEDIRAEIEDYSDLTDIESYKGKVLDIIDKHLKGESNDADVTKEIDCDLEWGIWGETWDDVVKKYGEDVDNAANAIHDRIVKEMKIKIREAYANAKAR